MMRTLQLKAALQLRAVARALASLLLLSLVQSATAGAAAPIHVTDELGHTLQWSVPPQRIVTLLPSLTESVCALGACDRLVGVDRFSNYPAQVNKLPKVGGLDDTQVETIVALRPDVVIVAPSSRVQERLTSLGLKVLVLETRTEADIRQALLTLGTMLAQPDPLAVWRAIDADIVKAAATVPPSMRGLSVYYEVDSGPYAAGASSFMGETMARLGLQNIVGKELGPFPKLNPEFIVRAAPQIIMVGERNLSALNSRPGWSQIPAIKNHRVCIFTADETDVLARPGPRLAEGAAVMARCLRELAAHTTAAAVP